MPDYSVMISYSEADENFAKKILEHLRANNIQCWIGFENIRRADSWPASISRAIRQCSIFLLILTPNSNNSRQVVRELTEADRLGKILYCYQTSDFTISDDIMYFFTSIQRLEAFDYEPKKALSIMLNDIKESLASLQSNQLTTDTEPVKPAPTNINTGEDIAFGKGNPPTSPEQKRPVVATASRITGSTGLTRKWYTDWRIVTPAAIVLLGTIFLLLKGRLSPSQPPGTTVVLTTTDSLSTSGTDTPKNEIKTADSTNTPAKEVKKDEVATALLSYYTYYNKGLIHFDNNDYQNAIKNFTVSLEYDKNKDSAYYFRGSSNYSLNNYNDAISDFSRSIQLNTNIPDVFFKRGYCYFVSSDYPSSINDFTKALAVNSNDQNALLFRGYAYYFAGRFQEALSDLSNAVKVIPSSGEAYYFKASAEESLKIMERACEDYKQSADLGYKKALAKVKAICTPPSASEIIANVEVHVRKDRDDRLKNNNQQFAYHYYLTGNKKYLNSIREARYVRNHNTFWEYQNKTYQPSTDFNNNFDYKGYQWGDITDVYLTIITKDGSVSETMVKTLKYDN